MLNMIVVLNFIYQQMSENKIELEASGITKLRDSLFNIIFVNKND